jgi:hypothetical protein
MNRFHNKDVISMIPTHQQMMPKETLYGHSCARTFVIKIIACNYELCSVFNVEAQIHLSVPQWSAFNEDISLGCLNNFTGL